MSLKQPPQLENCSTEILKVYSPLISNYRVQIRAFSVVLGHLKFSLASSGTLTAHRFHKSGPCFKLST